jgi:cytochrome c oxidase assembly protein subunit 15
MIRPRARFRRALPEPPMTPESTVNQPMNPSPDANGPRYRLAPHWFAVIAAVFTWPLLFVGGLVTTYRVGMAVPDWPTTFGINMFLFDMREAAWGVFIEHGHRLYGAAVGVCTILLMLDFLAFDRRKSVKLLGVFALMAVIAQGVLGGLRVNNNSTTLAMIHGCTGQAYFAFVVVLATITARSWFVERSEVENAGRLKALAVATMIAAYLQVVLGAWLRHFGSVGALMSHAGLALGVIGLVGVVAWNVRRRQSELPGLIGPVRVMELTVAIQAVLGIAAWWMLRPFDGTPRAVSTVQALIRTGHQANAALLLASAAVLVLRLYGRAAGVPAGVAETSIASPIYRELEVVA